MGILQLVLGDTATSVAIVLMLLQVVFLYRLIRGMYLPLWAGIVQVKSAQSMAGQGRTAIVGGEAGKPIGELDSRLQEWNEYLGTRPTREAARQELLELLDPATLQPDRYQPRVDNAAPGLFVAVGILGTFIGLIVAFSGGEESNVRQLMGTMRFPFANSALGVFLAILITWGSRKLRQLLDAAIGSLQATLWGHASKSLQPEHAQRREHERRLLEEVQSLAQAQAALAQQQDRHHAVSQDGLKEAFTALVSETRASSSKLIEELAPRLESSIRTLVDTPFNQLGATVASFHETTEQLTARQRELVESTLAAADRIVAVQGNIVAAADAISVQAVTLGRSSDALTASAEQAARVLESLSKGNTSLREVREWIEAGSARLGDLLGALEGTRDALVSTSDQLAQRADRYSSEAERFSASIEQLRITALATKDASLESMQDELKKAASAMTDALTEASSRTISAYSTASASVNEVLEEHMADVADRLNAQLGQMLRMVPDQVNTLTQATERARVALEKAAKQLEGAAATLGEQATQQLRNHLKEYDGAVVEIHRRLAGTLSRWEDRAESLEQAVNRLAEAASGAKAR